MISVSLTNKSCIAVTSTEVNQGLTAGIVKWCFRRQSSCEICVLLSVPPPAVCFKLSCGSHNGPVKPVSGCPRQLLVVVEKKIN